MADNVITVEFTPLDTFQSTDIQTISSTTYVPTNRLDTLDDVTEPEGVANNMTLVYNSATDKYTVQELNLDGGTF